MIFVLPALLLGDAGVLIPTNIEQPKPETLTLDEMAIDIWIDNGNSRVLIRQIWGSHVSQVLEGNTRSRCRPGRLSPTSPSGTTWSASLA